MAWEFLRSRGVLVPPVDAEAMVRSLAEVVVFSDERWDGFSLYDVEADRYVVYVTVGLLASGRSRFTWAHELGHIVLGHLRDYDCNRLSESELQVLDREADIFAAELLMPKVWLEKFVPGPCDTRTMARVKDLFGVSWEALIARLDELGLQAREVSEATLAEYAAKKPAREWRGLWRTSRMRTTSGDWRPECSRGS